MISRIEICSLSAFAVTYFSNARPKRNQFQVGYILNQEEEDDEVTLTRTSIQMESITTIIKIFAVVRWANREKLLASFNCWKLNSWGRSRKIMAVV